MSIIPNTIFERGTYVAFIQADKQNPKTRIWNVVTLSEPEIELGQIKWWGAWRKYVFEPHPNTIYEEVCLGDISQFIIQETKKHRESWKVRAASTPQKAITEEASR